LLASNKRFAEDESLYRLSKGHGGVMCEGCHGSTHAIWPVGNPFSNDNIASVQLQGHSGTIIECTTCHAENSLGLTLDGPHGMHPVGDANWNENHEDFARANLDACRTCHGPDGEAKDERCGTGFWCDISRQPTGECVGTLAGGDDCARDRMCSSGACLKGKCLGTFGDECGESACAQGLCVDGVCCRSPCQSPCASCNVETSEGRAVEEDVVEDISELLD